MIKEINIQISVKHKRDSDKTLQTFIILGKKTNRRFLFNNKFLLHSIFNRRILEFSLSNKDGYTFLNKIEEDDKIILEFETEKNENLEDFYFTISDFIPPVFGCEYCKFFKEEVIDERIECLFYRKSVKRRKGSCKYFKQRRLFKT